MPKCLENLIFFIVLQEIAYSLFNFFFDILWSNIYLNYVPKFGSEDLVYNDLFTSQRDSHFVPDMEFLVKLSLILFQLELSREEFTKLA